jgi:hypothetical protein
MRPGGSSDDSPHGGPQYGVNMGTTLDHIWRVPPETLKPKAKAFIKSDPTTEDTK